eukprot:7257105-Prymnesium_polylepis.1
MRRAQDRAIGKSEKEGSFGRPPRAPQAGVSVPDGPACTSPPPCIMPPRFLPHERRNPHCPPSP